MELPAPEEDKNRFQGTVQAYGELVRNAVVFLGWTVAVLIAGGTAFLILRAGWWVLLMALGAMGEI